MTSPNGAGGPPADPLPEALTLVRGAADAGLKVKILGGLGVRVLCPEFPPRQRAGQDIDFACLGKTRRQIADHLEQAGCEPDKRFNNLNGDRQMYFTAPSGRPIDVMVDKLSMCHVLDLRPSFGTASPTLDPADLLLSKLQIIELNAKDAHDIFHLLSGVPVGRDPAGPAIDPDRFGSVLATDWGWWRTVTGSLGKLPGLLAEQPDLVPPRPRFDPLTQAKQLQDVADSVPKGLKWKLRANIGDKVRWYELPEEVEHLSPEGGPMKIFFATDIHGSEICWRKFLNAAAFYKADMVILGGDVTGKVMVPILAYPGYWELTYGGERIRLETQAELDDIQRKIRDRGSYPTVLDPDELDALNTEDAVDRRFTAEMTRGLDRWLDMADGKLHGGQIPCILNGGNDDVWEIDDIIERSPCVSFAESKVLDIGGFYLASCGWTNPTPWNTFREAPEDVLATKIDAVVQQIPDIGRAIFNFHAPPYGSGLDEAPALDDTLRPVHGGAVMKPVGSVAVRNAIGKYQPVLSVHGHIHESRGIWKSGRTLAMNPGSSYNDGVLQGAIIDLNEKKGKVTRHLLVNG